MNNYQLSEKFNEMAVMCEYAGENIFKARAFSKAAEAIASLDYELYEAEGDFEIAGAGKGVKEIISDFLNSGASESYEKLRRTVPADLFLMLNISGIGVKKLKTLCETLQINKIEDLLAKAESGKVRQVKGFSAAGEANIIDEIKRIQSEKNSKLYFIAERLFYDTARSLKHIEAVLDVVPAGELARKLPVIKKISCAVIYSPAFDSESVCAMIAEKLGLVGCQTIHEGGLSVLTARSASSGSLLDFFLVRSGDTEDKIKKILALSDDYIESVSPNLLPCATGSGSADQTARALERINAIAVSAEEPDWLNIAPEHSEVLWKKIPPRDLKNIKPSTTDKIKGIFHVHSSYSDGVDPLETVVFKAREMGLAYIGITDHSKSSPYAGGLDEERLMRQSEEIDRLNDRYRPFKIFKGIECDILKDGSLDFSDDILKTLDFVIISIHSNFKMSESEMSARLVRAISNPYVTMLGHMTGRLLTKRKGYALNEELIFQAARKNDVIIELNSNPYRMDVDYKHFLRLHEMGILISINPDSHSIADAMQCVNYGVNAVNLGGMPESHIFNAKTIEEIEMFFNFKKETAGGKL